MKTRPLSLCPAERESYTELRASLEDLGGFCLPCLGETFRNETL